METHGLRDESDGIGGRCRGVFAKSVSQGSKQEAKGIEKRSGATIPERRLRN